MAIIIDETLGQALADEHIIGDSCTSKGCDSATEAETRLHGEAVAKTIFATSQGNQNPGQTGYRILNGISKGMLKEGQVPTLNDVGRPKGT